MHIFKGSTGCISPHSIFYKCKTIYTVYTGVIYILCTVYLAQLELRNSILSLFSSIIVPLVESHLAPFTENNFASCVRCCY